MRLLRFLLVPVVSLLAATNASWAAPHGGRLSRSSAYAPRVVRRGVLPRPVARMYPAFDGVVSLGLGDTSLDLMPFSYWLAVVHRDAGSSACCDVQFVGYAGLPGHFTVTGSAGAATVSLGDVDGELSCDLSVPFFLSGLPDADGYLSVSVALVQGDSAAVYTARVYVGAVS